MLHDWEHKMLARQLRSRATREENMLWYDLLSKYPVRFFRQRPIGRYIADFYCPTRKVVIEVDGKQHGLEDAKEYDSIRTDFFNCMGIEDVRFSNEDIRNRWAYVRDVIEVHVPLSPS